MEHHCPESAHQQIIPSISMKMIRSSCDRLHNNDKLNDISLHDSEDGALNLKITAVLFAVNNERGRQIEICDKFTDYQI